MKAALPLVVVALTACTGGLTPAAGTTPLAQASASAGQSPAPSPSAAGPALACRLPVVWAASGGFKAGFLTFPDQLLHTDPTAPAGAGFYDRAFAKWLPTGRSNVSPDGRRYAYTDGNALHVVDVATGVDRVVYSGGPVSAVVDYAAAGIYFSAAATQARPQESPRGLWLLDPSGGQPKLISSEIVEPAVGGGAAWGLRFNAADPSPGPTGAWGPRNEVLHFDLRTGASTSWLYRPGAHIWILGFDAAGHPFVRVLTEGAGTEPDELLLLQSPSQATRLYAGNFPAPDQLGAVDAHGVWFDSFRISPNTVWLYAGGVLRKVAVVDVAGVFDVFVAGGCIP